MPKDASGKVIAITGANGGLGRALAQRFAHDGERVILMGRSMQKVQEIAASIGPRALAVECDVTRPNSIRAAFAMIAQTYPTIDVFINNAGVFHPFLVEEASDEQILDGILTNLAGPILCARSVIPMMKRGGLIINVSSESINVPFAHLLIYQSSKAGLERFSLGLHEELEGRGIRTCIVRAGQMMGPGSSARMEPQAAARFVEASLRRGVDLMKRGTTQYQSATAVFRHLIDLPSDLHLDLVSCHARTPG